MIAARNPLPTDGMRGINVVLRRDGSEIHIDDIETAAHGQEILDEIDAAILQIEDQIAYAQQDDRDADWRRRAQIALKRKRRQRPTLQQRIGALRRAERQALPQKVNLAGIRPGLEAKRTAFINAAEELLDAELFTEIWARAAEVNPAAFAKAETGNA